MKLGAGARIAVYYAPRRDDPLWKAGSAWLGRDACSDATMPQPDVEGIGTLTAGPARYGFHATLKAPFRLVDGAGWDDLVACAESVCRRSVCLPLPRLRVDLLDGYLALVPVAPCPALRGLADLAVEVFDELRAPPDAAEQARRGAPPGAHGAMLTRWGYPEVFALWRFHMTLSARVPGGLEAALRSAGERWMADALTIDRYAMDICLFVQPGAGHAFRLMQRCALG